MVVLPDGEMGMAVMAWNGVVSRTSRGQRSRVGGTDAAAARPVRGGAISAGSLPRQEVALVIETEVGGGIPRGARTGRPLAGGKVPDRPDARRLHGYAGRRAR